MLNSVFAIVQNEGILEQIATHRDNHFHSDDLFRSNRENYIFLRFGERMPITADVEHRLVTNDSVISRLGRMCKPTTVA